MEMPISATSAASCSPSTVNVGDNVAYNDPLFSILRRGG
jgi:biotin carboxyl carrier protein